MRDLGLTPKERAVCRCLLEGYTNARIASELGTKYNTVKCHLHRASEKMGHQTALETTLFLIRQPWALAQVMETEYCPPYPKYTELTTDVGC